MEQFRSVDSIFRGTEPHMVGDGFRVSQYLPISLSSINRVSPFLLLDYNIPHYFGPSSVRLGVDAHPHRGFETVTIAYSGKVEHHDNKGNYGVIGPGDVQWMTAASGVLHKEYHEKEFSEKGGVLHMIQLWVNLPSDKKMVEPKYQTLLSKDMGIVKLDNNEGEISIISGEVAGTKGPANTFTDINLYNVKLKNSGKIILNEPSTFNTGILVLEGKVKINEESIGSEKEFVLFNNVEGDIKVESITENSLFIVLSGEPIDEPIVSHGPFVMNTIEEIQQAYKDFRDNKFGSEEF